MFPNEIKDTDIQAPAGFIHGYDLARIFIVAMQQVTLTHDKNKNSEQLKLALESLHSPIEGLIKTYNTPFSAFSRDNIDAHEALGAKDLCMATFDEHNAIKIEPKSNNEIAGRP